MLSIACIAALVMVGGEVRIDSRGISVDGKRVWHTELKILGAAGAQFLVSSTSIEPLTASVKIRVGEQHILVVDPGVRVRLDGSKLKLTTHNKWMRLLAGQDRVGSSSEVTLTPVSTGWLCDGIPVEVQQLNVEFTQEKQEKQERQSTPERQGKQEKIIRDSEVTRQEVQKVGGPLVNKPATQQAEQAEGSSVGSDSTVSGGSTDTTQSLDAWTIRRVFDVSPSGF